MVQIGLFKHATNQRQLEPGEVLFREGDSGDVMYAVVEGTISLTAGGRVVEEVGESGILGEMAIIDQSPRSATATAITAARVVPVDVRQFTFLVQEHPNFAILVMTVMVERLRRLNATVQNTAR